MNASASALIREDEIRSKIRKVSTFGRTARVVCAAIFGFGLVVCVVGFFVGVLGLTLSGPNTDAGFTPHQRIAALSMRPVMLGIWLPVVYQLYRLFGNLATGAIYTPETVRRVRHVGLLYLLGAALVALGFAEPSDSPKLEAWFSFSESLNSFVTAGLILLVSWVMDVGLYEKDHADALQRDADLVI